MNWLINSWYQPHPIRWLLWPLSLLYRAVISIRSQLYRLNRLHSASLSVPVIIIGNITVGGTGKTPTVIWLAKQLKKAGLKPGIISRGYGGNATQYPLKVTEKSLASDVGDEPIIIHRQSACPMVVGPNRIAAGQMLLEHNDCDVIISDDGLQHYALQRDIEIVVVDAQRLFGNQQCLPAGPLREPLSRLKSVDFIIHNGSDKDAEYCMSLHQGVAINLVDPTIHKPLSDFYNKKVHAVAGIGNPQRFFTQLTQQKIDCIIHPFPDHHPFQAEELDFKDEYPILMTEKDAVKCQGFTNKNMWYIPIEATINGKLDQHILNKLSGLTPHG